MYFAYFLLDVSPVIKNFPDLNNAIKTFVFSASGKQYKAMFVGLLLISI